MESVFLNPKGPSMVYYREKKFHDLIEYVPKAALEKAEAALEEMKQRTRDDLQIYRKPYEQGSPVPEKKSKPNGRGSCAG